MATVTAEQVKKLRELTDAGFMECKRALEVANGDIEAAIQAMRKAGMSKAAKKADRTAAEGTIVIVMSSDHRSALMLEVNCETDFVARDPNFTTFAHHAAERALAAQAKNVDAVLALPYETGADATVESKRHELVAKLGENVQFDLILSQAPGTIGSYKHGSKIGVLVQLDVNNPELGKDLAMHIAASKPLAVAPENVSPEIIAKEREIFAAQANASGKPAAIIEKMIAGRITKFLSEITLLGQPFVKNPDQTIADLLKSANAKVLGFTRFEVGEGIEKSTGDFAAEVMAQVRGH